MRLMSRYRGAIGIALLLLLVFAILSFLNYLYVSATFFTTSISLLGLLGVLLAVTFTSYSLLFVALPFIKKMLQRSYSVGGVGVLFLFTIYVEMTAIIVDFLIQVANARNMQFLGIMSVIDFYLATFSFLMIGLLSYYVHLIFENARKSQGN